MRVLALIAARSGSKGLIHKNVRRVGGVPLLVRAVRLAHRISPTDWSVAVSTDDERYAELARRAGAQIIVRPPQLATDESTLIDVVLHAIDQIDCDVVVLLSATTPLIRASDVRRAFVEWTAHRVGIATVTRDTPPSLRFELAEGCLQATTETPPGRRQLSNATYRLNGAVYIATPAWLRQHRRFVVPGLSRGVIISRRRSVDIDTRADLALVRALLDTRSERRQSAKTLGLEN